MSNFVSPAERIVLETRYTNARTAHTEAVMLNAPAAEQDTKQAELSFARMAIADKGGSTYGWKVVWPAPSAEEFVSQKFPGTKPLDISMRAIALEVITEFLATQEA